MRRDERSAALKVAVAVERRLPGPGAGRRAAAAHHPAPPHALVSYSPNQHNATDAHTTHLAIIFNDINLKQTRGTLNIDVVDFNMVFYKEIIYS